MEKELTAETQRAQEYEVKAPNMIGILKGNKVIADCTPSTDAATNY